MNAVAQVAENMPHEEHQEWFWLCRLVGEQTTLVQLEPFEPKIYAHSGVINGAGRITYVVRKCKAWVVHKPSLAFVSIDISAKKARQSAERIKAKHYRSFAHG